MGRRGGLIHDILEQQYLREAVSIIPHENQNIVLGERPRLLSPRFACTYPAIPNYHTNTWSNHDPCHRVVTKDKQADLSDAPAATPFMGTLPKSGMDRTRR